jgi:predicted RNA-binding protein with PIN domain
VALRHHPFLRGVLEALLLPLAFCALGLAWWGTALRAEGAPPTYPRAWMEAAAMTQAEPASAPAEWLIDGFNVVQVGLLGGQDRSRWWSAARRAQLLSQVAAFQPSDASLWVVFDGGLPRPESEREGRTRVVFAPSADEWLVARVRRAEDPSRLVVVTADRRLAARVRHLGARVSSPAEFLARCGDALDRGDITSV